MKEIKKNAEIHVLGECNCLVMTGDVLSFAVVTSDSFPSPRVCCFGRHSVNCVSFCLTQCRVEQLLLSTACAVRELTGTSGACCFFLRCQFLPVTRL